jgi:hypothetical protein
MARIRVPLLLITLAAAGCVGGSAASSAPSSTGGSPRPAGDAVRWTVSYGVGQDKPSRAGVAPCPSGAACTVVRDLRVTFSNGRHGWQRIATRHLTCPVASGEYAESARACQAIARLRTILSKRAAVVCSCPLMLGSPGKAVAVIHGHKVVVPLDFCTYCGRSTSTTASDLAALQPQT